MHSTSHGKIIETIEGEQFQLTRIILGKLLSIGSQDIMRYYTVL